MDLRLNRVGDRFQNVRVAFERVLDGPRENIDAVENVDPVVIDERLAFRARQQVAWIEPTVSASLTGVPGSAPPTFAPSLAPMVSFWKSTLPEIRSPTPSKPRSFCISPSCQAWGAGWAPPRPTPLRRAWRR